MWCGGPIHHGQPEDRRHLTRLVGKACEHAAVVDDSVAELLKLMGSPVDFTRPLPSERHHISSAAQVVDAPVRWKSSHFRSLFASAIRGVCPFGSTAVHNQDSPTYHRNSVFDSKQRKQMSRCPLSTFRLLRDVRLSRSRDSAQVARRSDILYAMQQCQLNCNWYSRSSPQSTAIEVLIKVQHTGASLFAFTPSSYCCGCCQMRAVSTRTSHSSGSRARSCMAAATRG